MKFLFVIGAAFVFAMGFESFAGDLGFRYKDGKCVNSAGAIGLNASYFGQCSDLRGTVLNGLDFSGMDFRGSSFVSADLQRSSFQKANLEGTSFESAMLTGVKFDEAFVVKANFNKAILKQVKFSETQIAGTSFENAIFEGSDLSYVQFNKCNLKGANFSKSRLDEAQFIMSDVAGAQFADSDLTKAQFNSANISEVNFTNARLNSANLSDVSGAKAVFEGANLSSANLARAQLPDARFLRARFASANMEGVVSPKANFSGADLSGVKLMKTQFPEGNFNRTNFTGADLSNSNLQKANLKGSVLKDVKFDGVQFKEAVISKNTVLPFSTEDAQKMGMVLLKVRTVLILWDVMNDYVKSFAAALATVSAGEVEATLSPVIDSAFNGTQVVLSDFDSVLHLNGAQPHNDEISVEGQKALVTFVNNGGTFIYGEWEAFAVQNGRFTQMKDLILFQRTSGTNQGATHTIPDVMKTHPLMTGVSSPFAVASSAGNIGPVVVFPNNPVTVLATDSRNSPSVGLRQLGKGWVVAFNYTCTYEGVTCLNEAPTRQLYINAITNLD